MFFVYLTPDPPDEPDPPLEPGIPGLFVDPGELDPGAVDREPLDEPRFMLNPSALTVFSSIVPVTLKPFSF
jgi:hypothetical protein